MRGGLARRPASGKGLNEHPLVDTHLHMWDVDRSPYDWLRKIPALDHTHRVSDGLPELERLGVTAAVLIQSDDTDSDTDVMLAAARDHQIVRGLWVTRRFTTSIGPQPDWP
ncbi:hypothetical protein ACI7YT_08980 [Microbacterium sp. M]|uniref:hypothetical protein n=1 Tax=Microbacterium sp. M TaxID=3377125 RepID=UPI00386CA1C6